MLHLLESPTDIQKRLARLSHSWLKNQILAFDPNFVVRMHNRAALLKAKADFEQKIQPGGVFHARIGEARQLVRDMPDGFSPKQLVDDGPLKSLSLETREKIKSVLHREYLLQSEIEQLVLPMNRAIDDLENALRSFSEMWFEQDVDPEMIKTRFEQVQVCAGSLHELMANLPEGIVLP